MATRARAATAQKVQLRSRSDNENGTKNAKSGRFDLGSMATRMLDVAPVNIICADLNGIIRYVNPSTILTLRKIEQFLPIKVDDIVGTCIDVFHKNPEHQRRLLSDPRNLPHRAAIQVGPVKLDLLVAAVMDIKGSYVATMVTWGMQDTAGPEAQLAAVSRVMAVISFDMNGTVLDANDNFLSTMGYQRDEVVGKGHRMFVDPTYAESPEYRTFWSNLRAGQPCVAVFQRIGKNGKQILLQASYNPILDAFGNPVKVVKFATDLTEQTRQAAEAERQKQLIVQRTMEAEAEASEAALQSVTKLVEAVEQGHLRNRINVTEMSGKYRDLCDSVNRMMDGIASPLDEISLVLGLVAEGDLRTKVDGNYANDLDALKQSVNRTIEQLSEIAGEMRGSAGHVAHAAEEISSGTADLSKRTEMQAAELEETASTMEEMTATVKQNADNARQANQLALGARSVAEKGGSVVQQAVGAMEEINRASAKIADIVGVIDAIAFQTNLLALNAAVEAARAGEQGRGFAVVASEVRNLAQRSATAAKEIKGLIKDSTAKVEDGSRLVLQSGATLSEIVSSVKKVADIVGEISAASQEQSTAIEQVNKAVVKMDESTQQNSALVEETASAAASLAKQGAELLDTVARFQTHEQEEAPRAAPPSARREEPSRAKVAPNRGKAPTRAAPATAPASRGGAPAKAGAANAGARIANGAKGRAKDEDGFLEF